MVYTCSLSNLKKFENIKRKYFIVINPKSVKVKGLIHRPELAPTRELYQWAMENKNNENWFEYYKTQFEKDMKTRAGLINGINQLAAEAKETDILLVCFCTDVNQCHRGIIADELKARGLDVTKE